LTGARSGNCRAFLLLLFLSLFCSSRKLLNTTKLGKECTHSIGARKGAYKRRFRSVFLSLSLSLCLYGGRLSCCFNQFVCSVFLAVFSLSVVSMMAVFLAVLISFYIV
jgi:hypothetical protein